MSKTASGLSPATLRTAVAKADTVPDAKRYVDMANTAVEACKRTRRSIEETNEYATIALEATIRAGELLTGLERTPPQSAVTVSGDSPYRQALTAADVDERTAQRWQEAYRFSDNLTAYLTSLGPTETPTWHGFVERFIKLGGLKGSTSVEWYTPEPIIEAARQVLGAIDLDPASSELANQLVGADTYFTKDDDPDGLSQDWFGRVWLNPPYGKGTGLFTTKLIEEHQAGRVAAAVLLINAYGFDSEWFQPLWNWPLCFTRRRVVFYSPQRESGGPANGNVLAYVGPEPSRFAEGFAGFGTIVRRWP